MAVVLGTNAGFVTEAPEDPIIGASITLDDRSAVMKDTSPATAGRITEIGWRCDDATEEANYEVGLYAADGAVVPGEAGTLLHVERTNAKGTTDGWKRVTVDWDIDPNTDYWLAVQLDNTATKTEMDYGIEGGLGMDMLLGESTLPDSFGGGDFFDDYILAIYAVWDVAAPEAVVRRRKGIPYGFKPARVIKAGRIGV